jgi:hypothetical protein
MQIIIIIITLIVSILSHLCPAALASICNQNNPPKLPCDEGFFCSNVIVPGGNQCISCSAGKYSDITSSTPTADGCKKCARGKYEDEVASSSCKDCLEGQYGDSEGLLSCSKCPKGKFNDIRGLINNCKVCSAGRAGEVEGGTTFEACKECPSGKYAYSGATSCKNCNSQFPLSARGTTSLPKCGNVCPVGTYLASGTQCDTCVAGKALKYSTGVHSCVECEAGKYSLSDYIFCANDGGNCFCNGIVRRYHYKRNDYPNDMETGYKYLNVMGTVKCNSALFGESGPIVNNGVNLACSCSAFSTKCSNCDIGYYSSRPGEEACKSCSPGRFNTAQMETSCKECAGGTVQSGYGKSSCENCVAGKAAIDKSKACVECPGGTYTAVDLEANCKQCEAGQYSELNIMSTTCKNCPNGRKSPPQTSKTIPDDSTSLRCYRRCPKGSYAINGQCASCDGGKYKDNTNDDKTCEKCRKGKYNSDGGVYFKHHEECTLCAGGQYSAREESLECTLCNAGYVLPNITNSPGKDKSIAYKYHDSQKDCEACVVGKSTNGKPGEQFCTNCPSGLYSREGSAACYDASGLIEDESLYIAEQMQLIATRRIGKKIQYSALKISGCFVPSVGGQSHANITCSPVYDDSLENIPHGYFVQWSHDRDFKTLVGSSKVDLNKRFKFHFQMNLTKIDITNKTLHIRVASYNNMNEQNRGKWSLADTWLNRRDCDFTREFLDIDGIYFQNEKVQQVIIEPEKPSTWKCRQCPVGSSCEGHYTWPDVRAKFGYWRYVVESKIDEGLKKKYVSFLECAIHEACLGAKNDDLAFRIDISNRNKIPLDTSERCNEMLGFEEGKRLCAVCSKGYHVMDTFGNCKVCPSIAAMVVSLCFAFVALVVLLAFITYTTVKEVDIQKSQAEVIKRIVLNYFQMISLASTFPYEWPEEIRVIFTGSGIFSSIGESLISIDCVFRDYDKYVVFYIRQTAFALLPIIAGALLYIFWKLYAICMHLNVGKRTQRNETTAKDRFVVSFNAFLFLLYPHSCKVVLSVFSCKYIGDDYYHSYDVSVRCYTGPYFIFLVLFGIPLTIIYIIGLPSTVFYFLRKHRARLDERVVKLRWGIFYRGFRRNRFYWELTVAVRKLLFVAIGVIQVSLTLKAVLALATIQQYIYFHITCEPYNRKKYPILHDLEYWSLLIVFFTMCFGLLYTMKNGDFRVLASIIIISMNLSFTIYVFKLYISEYLREHEYFRDANCIPAWVFTFWSKVCKILGDTKKKLWNCCMGVKFNRMFDRVDQINENEEWVRIFDHDLGRFYYSHDSTCTIFWEYYPDNVDEKASIREEGEKMPRESGWRRYWDVSSTWKSNNAVTSRWYFHQDDRSMTRWAKENPEAHPNGSASGLNLEMVNPLRALVTSFRRAPVEGESKRKRKKRQDPANSNPIGLEMTHKKTNKLDTKPEKPPKKKRPTMDMSWNRKLNEEHHAYFFTSPDGKLIKWEQPVAEEEKELPTFGWILYLDDKPSREYFYNKKINLSRWVYSP